MSQQSDKPVAVIGCGGHGRVVIDALTAAGRNVIAATDHHPDPNKLSGYMTEIMSDDQLIGRFKPDSVDLALGVGSLWPTDAKSIRPSIVDRFERLGFRFIGFVHPAAFVAQSVVLDETAQIHAGVIVQSGAKIGKHAIINTRASVDHDCSIGDYVHVGPGAVLSGNVEVESGSHLGTGCVVIQGIQLGSQSFVSAGAVVVKSVSGGEYVRGVPARSFTPRR